MWNSFSNNERLRMWKELRENTENSAQDKKLEEIADFCATMPLGPRALDYYNSEDWPSPWEILYYATFCISSISLLMFYTLTMTGFEDVDLYLVEDCEDRYLLPVIANQFVLNYELGKVNRLTDIKKHFSVIKIFSRSQIKTIY